MTGELAPLHHPEDRCFRCSTAFGLHDRASHNFTPIPARLLREYVLTDQARRYLAFDALYWRRA